ncbi:MAG: alanine--tRNA ligase, partial [Oscillospiraceae bacterium]|nr:alanine--tRNA ligase [Oscillospiraceae bacterium]
MKWTGVNELRESFLSFFESKNHTRLASAALVPKDDPSLLLINSGMAPLKNYFLHPETAPNTKCTSCQKCIRTPDIENIGKTDRHGTYFEMLGNFSFGDYFKEEATTWAWEFFTKVLEIPEDKLYVTVYEEDDEAFDIWTKRRGVPASHVKRMGKADNFWEHGTGPCGPCSEIYFDRGPEHGCGSPDCTVGCECDRYMEVWNLVFTQFDSDGEGTYAPLDHPNIDTGMGLERLACVMQGVNNLFEVDTVQNIMKHISDLAGVKYHEDAAHDVSLRVITDHIRSTTFMVGDGVTPSNEGRGYVLRRLLRRAARHGRLLGIKRSFLYEVASTVIAENLSAYPELKENEDYIRKVIQAEEERFGKTVDQGTDRLNEMMERLKAEGQTQLTGEDAFLLHDTFGFPIDLTKDVLEENGLTVDEERFAVLMKEQRAKARAASGAADAFGGEGDPLADLTEDATKFLGYTTLSSTAKVVAMVNEGELTGMVNAGQNAVIVLDQTPFYAESGGQVGDTGVITGPEGVFQVTDTQKTAKGHFAHTGVVLEGHIKADQQVEAAVDTKRRAAIARNHSSCHLLQAALREVLGTHVHQSGSLVNEEHCRFDFTHFSAMTAEEIAKTEALVNEMIFDAMPGVTEEMPIEEAKKLGAMALFGE